MDRLIDWTVANVDRVLAFIMLATALVVLAYVLVRDRRLLKSPVFWIVAGAPVWTSALSETVGWLKPDYAGDPRALAWIFHLGAQAAGCGVVAAQATVMVKLAAKSLPDVLERFRRLHRFVATAPLAILAGYALGTLILLFGPSPTTDLEADASLWAFGYRACVQLVPMLYATAMCVLLLCLHAKFGEPQDTTQVALKKRFVPAAVGAASWVLLYLDHLAWPLVALLWPETHLGTNAYRYHQMLVPPIMVALVVSHMVMALRPYCPSGTARFSRYRALTENLGLQTSPFLGRTWMLRYRWSRADRLIELISADLGLSPDDRGRARDLYAVAAVAKTAASPKQRVLPWWSRCVVRLRTALAAEARDPQKIVDLRGPRPLAYREIEELFSLHREFLARPAGTKDRGWALQNRYAPLIPEALMIAKGLHVSDLTIYPRHVQMTAAVAADADLLPPDQRSRVLDPASSPIDPPTLAAYERALGTIEKRKAS